MQYSIFKFWQIIELVDDIPRAFSQIFLDVRVIPFKIQVLSAT
jgi:hypothetical protein